MNNSSGNNTEMTMADLYQKVMKLLHYLRSKFWLIVLFGGLAGALGIAYAWLQKPKYESRLTFSLYDNNNGLGGALSLAAEFGLNIGSGGQDLFAGDNILGILSSRRIIEDVLLDTVTLQNKPTTMADYYWSLGKKDAALKKQTIKFPAGMPRNQFTYQQDSLLATFYKDISKSQLFASKPDRKMNIYEVRFVSPDEKFTKIFTEKLIARVIAFYVEIRSKRSKETLQILENRVAEIKHSVMGAIGDRSAIRDANLNPAFANAEASLQKKQVDITTYGTAYAELLKNLELARYQYLKDIPLLQIIDAPLYPMKKIKQGRLLTGIVFGTVGAFLSIVWFVFSMFVQRWKNASTID